jgi:hypothetical protein
MAGHLSGKTPLTPAQRDALALRIQQLSGGVAHAGADEAGGEGSGGGHGSVQR